jgi:hypothetical protein
MFTNKKKQDYATPKAEVIRVETEGYIAASESLKMIEVDWIPDPDPQATYDGDIWMPM